MIIAIFFQRNFTELFETTGKTLAGRQFSLGPLYPFLKTGVIFAFFKRDGNVDFFIDSLKMQISRNIISINVIVLLNHSDRNIRFTWTQFSCLFINFSALTLLKLKSELLFAFLMKTIFGWFFHFSNALNVDSENLSAKGLVSQV